MDGTRGAPENGIRTNSEHALKESQGRRTNGVEIARSRPENREQSGKVCRNDGKNCELAIKYPRGRSRGGLQFRNKPNGQDSSRNPRVRRVGRVGL